MAAGKLFYLLLNSFRGKQKKEVGCITNLIKKMCLGSKVVGHCEVLGHLCLNKKSNMKPYFICFTTNDEHAYLIKSSAPQLPH